ncbi:MAG: RagB/SusD family nutrient uptake outer membrane protein [Proteiniphilum sp.]|nr:RagB/SusD family nutrient uptake outer membrane protein [Proteiniphilum sp.]MDD4417120.1 RagB/SusD family nutrient uptake outer membrane protein [Proteiniphilum sp.]
MKKFTAIIFLAFIILACSKSGDDISNQEEIKAVVKSTLTGKIEKGPFLTGSKVTLYELDDALKQTGQNIFKTETSNDNGEFLFDSKMELSSQFVELEITGFFYNEVTGKRSSSQITLNALADVSSKNKVNVNIITHLVYKRIKKIVSEGLSFQDAQKQAHRELLNNFLITTEVKNSDDISLTDGNKDSAILLAISAILLYNKEEAAFSEFIAKLSYDFESDGNISDSSLMEQIQEGQMNVNSIQVMDHLKSYFSDQGKSIEVDNIRKFIDGNGDGVLDDTDATFENNHNDVIIEDNIFSNEDGYRQVLTASYTKLRVYFEYMLVLDAARCNLIDYNTEIHSSNTILEDAWKQAYQFVNHLNMIIEHSVDVPSFDTKPYLSSSKVLRALIYLDMIQHWGDVPFITKQLSMGEMNVPRTNKNEILEVLLADLNESIPYLLEVSEHDQPFVSQDLANALIGSIYLEQKKYNEAASYFSKIIDDTYTISFENSIYSDIYNKEAVFTLLFPEDGNYQPSQIFSQFLKKGTLHPIYRNTSILIHYAETLNGLNRDLELLNVLNQIRVAGSMNPLQELPSNPKYEIADLWKQFIGQDYGYFALLKRLGIAVELLEIQSFQQLYPIPYQELSLNPNMTQNPGY